MVNTTKKMIFLSLITSLLYCTHITAGKLIKNPENRTKASLKEELGTEIKSTLNLCLQLNEHLARLQLEVTQVQKKLLAKGEELMENGPSFKKTNRKPLATSIEAASKVRQKLASLDNLLGNGTVKSVIKFMDGDECLGQKQIA